MGLFDANVNALRKVFEDTWRTIAREAAALDLLDLQDAEVEIRIVLKPKGRDPKKIESRSKLSLSAKDPLKLKEKQGDTAWRRLMEDED